jgi:hypothetical protein
MALDLINDIERQTTVTNLISLIDITNQAGSRFADYKNLMNHSLPDELHKGEIKKL